MASQAGGMLENGYDIKYIDDNATPNNNVFNNNNVGWLAALGWGGSLYDPLYEDVNNKDRLTGFGAFLPNLIVSSDHVKLVGWINMTSIFLSTLMIGCIWE